MIVGSREPPYTTKSVTDFLFVIFEKNEFAFQYHKTMDVDNERAIRAIEKTSVKTFAGAFSEKHLSQIDNEDGIINSKIHNVFIAALGSEIQYYSALCRSLDSSL